MSNFKIQGIVPGRPPLDVPAPPSDAHGRQNRPEGFQRLVILFYESDMKFIEDMPAVDTSSGKKFAKGTHAEYYFGHRSG